jgi:hypothetical protein
MAWTRVADFERDLDEAPGRLAISRWACSIRFPVELQRRHSGGLLEHA